MLRQRQRRAHMVPQHQGGGTMQAGRTVTAVIQAEVMVVLQAFEEHAVRLVLGIFFAPKYVWSHQSTSAQP